MQTYWIKTKLNARRLGIALLWSVRLPWHHYRMRIELIEAFGSEWVLRNLPRVPPSQILKANLEVLATAVKPSGRQEVAHRTRRFQRQLHALRQIPRRDYRVTTPAARRVQLAALARCLSSICAAPVKPSTLDTFVGSQPLCLALIEWCQSHLVDQYELYASLPASSGWTGLKAPTATTNATKRLRASQHVTQVVASYRIREQEVAAVIAEQKMRYLALPLSILRAYQTLQAD